VPKGNSPRPIPDYSRHLVAVIAGTIILGSIALSGAETSYESADRTFFRHEYGLDTHGRKTWFDHLVEVDPGTLKTHIAEDYQRAASERIAVLPFADLGSAQYVVDKIALTHRNADEQADWAWTDGNRMVEETADPPITNTHRLMESRSMIGAGSRVHDPVEIFAKKWNSRPRRLRACFGR